jgi:hypothetical protein
MWHHIEVANGLRSQLSLARVKTAPVAQISTVAVANTMTPQFTGTPSVN